MGVGDELLDEVAAFNRELLAGKGIALKVEARAPGAWMFDRGLVLGVLNAALGNAFRHARGEVALGCRREGQFVVFKIGRAHV